VRGFLMKLCFRVLVSVINLWLWCVGLYFSFEMGFAFLSFLSFSIFDIFGARLFDETLFSCSGQCDQPMVVIGGMSLIIWDVLCVFVLFALFHF
jgi:hypothetical protein